MTIYQIGKYYEVPTVHGENLGCVGHWPVLGPKHEDREIIDFPELHYHIDWRFVGNEFYEWMVRRGRRSPYGLGNIYSLVLVDTKNHKLGPVIHRRMKCKRDFPQYPAGVRWIDQLYDAYAEARLTDDLICPHRGASLASLPTDDAGCVTCPLHGLRWNLKTRRLWRDE